MANAFPFLKKKLYFYYVRYDAYVNIFKSRFLL